MRQQFAARHIVLQDRVIEGTLVVVDGQIAEIREEPIMTHKDQWLLPGLIEFHTHGFDGCNVSKTRNPDEVRQMAQRLITAGVTSFLPTTIASDHLTEVLEALAEAIHKPAEGAEILGIHCEGPFYNPRYNGGTPTENFWQPSVEQAESLWEAASHQIRIMALSPELENSQAVVQYFHSRGVLCSMGHTGASFQQTEQAMQEGYGLATHLFNAMAPLHHRQPGPAGALLSHPEFPCELNCDFHHGSPEMIRLVLKLRDSDSLVMISDSDALTGSPAGIYERDGLRQIVRDDGTITLEDGTIYGSGSTLITDLSNLVSLGMDIPRAVRMATLTPARMLGLDHRIGSLKPTKQADFFLADATGIQAVYQRGQCLFQKG